MSRLTHLTRRLTRWWTTGLSPGVKLVYLLLLANGVPACIILMSLPHRTQDLFVWTIVPPASARLLGVMYANALLLVAFGITQPDWPRTRVTVLLITCFSIAATVVTFFHLGPFLQHPWYHLAYWLTMYLALVIVAPLVFVWQERQCGGQLPIERALLPTTRIITVASSVVAGVVGLSLFVSPGAVSLFWPWDLTPLVGRILAVWFTSVAITFAWGVWDGDWVRTRPIFWQMIPTGALLALVPLLHVEDLRPAADSQLLLYGLLACGMVAGGILVLLSQSRTSRVARDSVVER
jgi:hypothetical protein